MRILKYVGVATAAAILLSVAACGEEEGSAEKAGKKVDKAAEQTSKAMKESGDALKKQMGK